MSPVDVPELRTTLDVRVMGLTKEIFAFVVEIPLPKLTDPTPVCENPLAPKRVVPAVVVKVPGVRKAKPIDPGALAVAFPMNVNEKPERLIPPAPLVETSPVKSVVPVAADCIMDEAVTAWAVTLRAVEISKLPRGVKDPVFPAITMSPVPVESVRLPGPLSVLKKVMG